MYSSVLSAVCVLAASALAQDLATPATSELCLYLDSECSNLVQCIEAVTTGACVALPTVPGIVLGQPALEFVFQTAAEVSPGTFEVTVFGDELCTQALLPPSTVSNSSCNALASFFVMVLPDEMELEVAPDTAASTDMLGASTTDDMTMAATMTTDTMGATTAAATTAPATTAAASTEAGTTAAATTADHMGTMAATATAPDMAAAETAVPGRRRALRDVASSASTTTLSTVLSLTAVVVLALVV